MLEELLHSIHSVVHDYWLVIIVAEYDAWHV